MQLPMPQAVTTSWLWIDGGPARLE